jgi:LPS export ABC transporter protein LptC
MMFKIISVLLFFFNLTCVPLAFAEKTAVTNESDQQISEFSLVGYGEKGKKAWDISGKSADITSGVVKLDGVEGNFYGKEEDVKLTAKKGDFDKNNGSVHLEDNVVITTSSGAELTTDSLDWDRKNQSVTTDDAVNIRNQNMLTTAKGAKAETNLKKVALDKEVKVELLPDNNDMAKDKEKISITCDGPLEIDYGNNLASFNNNVKVERPDSTIYSDRMDVYFKTGSKVEAGGPSGNSIEKIVARGNVKIVRGENVSYSDEAVYTALDQKIILSGRPRLVIYSEEDLKNASSGN